MTKRLKTPPNPRFKFIRGRRGRDAIRIDLPSGGVGFVATTIPPSALKAFAESLRRKIAKRRRLTRSNGPRTSSTGLLPDVLDADSGSEDERRSGRGDQLSGTLVPLTREVRMADVAARLEIRGHVQGVGYRWSMVEAARELGVRGWVRNRQQGWVEAMVVGPAEAIDQIVAWARRGPPAASVEAVEVFPGSGTFEAFEQRPSV